MARRHFTPILCISLFLTIFLFYRLYDNESTIVPQKGRLQEHRVRSVRPTIPAKENVVGEEDTEKETEEQEEAQAVLEETVEEESAKQTAAAANVVIQFITPEQKTCQAVTLTERQADMKVNGHSITFASAPSEPRKPEQLNIHVVFHSHVDPGWLKTFEDYYTSQVRDILGNAVKALNEYSDARFIWSETSFLERWWRDATEEQKTLFKKFVAEGRFELCGAAWVMTDEATPLFYASIENLIEGQQYVFDMFGARPNTSWSVDPFGHGSMLPHLLPYSGVDYMTVGRYHDYIKGQQRKRQNMRWRWKTPWNEAPSNGPLVNSLPYFVYTTMSQCVDEQVCVCYHVGPSNRFSCTKNQLRGDMTESNSQVISEELVKQLRITQSVYGTTDILMAAGDDFFFGHYDDWKQMYARFKGISEYLKKHPELNATLRFSTVSEFFNSIKNEKVPSMTGDLFPYVYKMENNHPWWTGYFVHRPLFKRTERILQNQLRSLDLIRILLNQEGNLEQLRTAKRDFSLFQHHDGITGTSKIPVMEDFYRRMLNASLAYDTNLVDILKKTTQKSDEIIVLNDLSGKNNSKVIDVGTDKFVTLFNPSTFVANHTISLRTNKPAKVLLEGVEVPTSIQPGVVFYEIYFTAQLKPWSFTSFKLSPSDSLTVSNSGNSKSLPIAHVSRLRLWEVADTGAAYVIQIARAANKTEIFSNSTLSDGSLVFTNGVILKARQTEDAIDVNIQTASRDGFTCILSIETDIDSADYYTDINGLFHYKRTYQNKYTDETMTRDLPYEASIFPVASSVFLQDEKTRVTVITGQPTGAVIKDKGVLELLVDRRLHGDDGKGLGSGDAFENRPALATYRIVVEQRNKQSVASAASLSWRGQREWSQHIYPPVAFVTSSQFKTTELLTTEWPEDVQLVTWRHFSSNQVLLVLRRIVLDGDFDGGQSECGKSKIDKLFEFITSVVSGLSHSNLSGTERNGTLATKESFRTSLNAPLTIASFIATTR